MEQTRGAANPNWCPECHQHRVICSCDPKINIYLVDYHMAIVGGMIPHWCDEQVRCVAYDEYQAISRVTNWAMATEDIWWNEDGEITEHRVPFGEREVSITKVEMYAEDVGELLKNCPLPDIFPHEE